MGDHSKQRARGRHKKADMVSQRTASSRLGVRAAMIGLTVSVAGTAVGGQALAVSGSGTASPRQQAVPPQPEELDPATAEKIYGIPQQNFTKFQQMAKLFDVRIQVRPTNPDSVKWLNSEQALPKPEAIKAKSITETDVHLGAKRENIGLVGMFVPKELDWSKYDKSVKARYEQRKTEYETLSTPDAMKKLKSAGYRYDTESTLFYGASGGTEKPITGDHDVFHIVERDGKRLEPNKVNTIVEYMKKNNMGVQHGAHMYWLPPVKDSHGNPTSFNSDIYKKIFNSHQPPAEGESGHEKLLIFSPDSKPALEYAAPPSRRASFSAQSGNPPFPELGRRNSDAGCGGQSLPLAGCVGGVPAEGGEQHSQREQQGADRGQSKDSQLAQKPVQSGERSPGPSGGVSQGQTPQSQGPVQTQQKPVVTSRAPSFREGMRMGAEHACADGECGAALGELISGFEQRARNGGELDIEKASRERDQDMEHWPQEAQREWESEWSKLPESQQTLLNAQMKANEATQHILDQAAEQRKWNEYPANRKKFFEFAVPEIRAKLNEAAEKPLREAPGLNGGRPAEGRENENLENTLDAAWRKDIPKSRLEQEAKEDAFELRIEEARLKSFDDGSPDADAYGKITATAYHGPWVDRQRVWSKEYENVTAHDDMKVGTLFPLKGRVLRSGEGFSIHTNVKDYDPTAFNADDTVADGAVFWRKGDPEGRRTAHFYGDDKGQIDVIYTINRLPAHQGQDGQSSLPGSHERQTRAAGFDNGGTSEPQGSLQSPAASAESHTLPVSQSQSQQQSPSLSSAARPQFGSPASPVGGAGQQAPARQVASEGKSVGSSSTLPSSSAVAGWPAGASPERSSLGSLSAQPSVPGAGAGAGAPAGGGGNTVLQDLGGFTQSTGPAASPPGVLQPSVPVTETPATAPAPAEARPAAPQQPAPEQAAAPAAPAEAPQQQPAPAQSVMVNRTVAR